MARARLLGSFVLFWRLFLCCFHVGVGLCGSVLALGRFYRLFWSAGESLARLEPAWRGEHGASGFRCFNLFKKIPNIIN